MVARTDCSRWFSKCDKRYSAIDGEKRVHNRLIKGKRMKKAILLQCGRIKENSKCSLLSRTQMCDESIKITLSYMTTSPLSHMKTAFFDEIVN
ncbi:hypothetical protein HNY73_003661 [Argiope bruennichi]|uniref:Uncharacterized protein n=1 Tax=Argiope bruennichi TaxID=94029 RepID=A0A8T0FQU0_ARGBR|nr:hypothetical protein HNY73_003661 [Argiope bruennichi]